MNELIISENGTISSKVISEITGKQHSDVMRDVRNLIEQLGAEVGGCSFALSSYFGENGKAFIDGFHLENMNKKFRSELPKTNFASDDLIKIQFNIYLKS